MRRKILRRAPQSGASRWPPRPPRSTMPRPRINRRGMRMWSGSPRSPTPRLLRRHRRPRQWGRWIDGIFWANGWPFAHARTSHARTSKGPALRFSRQPRGRSGNPAFPRRGRGLNATGSASSTGTPRIDFGGGRWRAQELRAAALAAIRSARSAALTLPETGIALHAIATRNAPAPCRETAGAALPGILSPRD
jgi:hypothetical protein